MNSEGCVFGLQAYKGYERQDGLHFFFKIRILILYAVEK